MTDFGCNGKDLVLVLVNYFSEISPLILNAIKCVVFYKQNDAF